MPCTYYKINRLQPVVHMAMGNTRLVESHDLTMKSHDSAHLVNHLRQSANTRAPPITAPVTQPSRNITEPEEEGSKRWSTGWRGKEGAGDGVEEVIGEGRKRVREGREQEMKGGHYNMLHSSLFMNRPMVAFGCVREHISVC